MLTLQPAIWLDDLPVGLLANGSQLHYIEPDHLGTPRMVIEVARNVPVWTWDAKGEAFGATAPNQNPDGDAHAFVFDLRFPGQRYDAASGLNYNYFRDYDTGSGRYVQSDPIGLLGGISTYAYVGGNPVTGIDPLGLASYDKTDLALITSHLIWLNNLQGDDFLTSHYAAPEGEMLARLAAGMESDYDRAFFFHEAAEAQMCLTLRASASDKALKEQQKIHEYIENKQESFTRDRYHPSIIKKYPELFPPGWQ